MDNTSDTSKGNDADKDDKNDAHSGDAVPKAEPVKTPSIQEPLFKAEKKDEETIHDSDFEEPSGLILLHLKCIYMCTNKYFRS